VTAVGAPMTTGGIAGGSGVPTTNIVPAAGAAAAPAATGVLGKLKSLPTSAKIGGGGALALLFAGFQYMAKRDEGKSVGRAATETGASVAGALGGVAAGAAIGSFLGPIGMAIGGVIGGYVGQKALSSFVEKGFNFFTGTNPEDFQKRISVFSKEFADMSLEDIKKTKITIEEQQEFNKRFRVESLQNFSTKELIEANNDIRRAREKDPAKESSQNFVISKGGDTTNNKIVNVQALEAELSRRGQPSAGGLGAK
jgi:hypothetical protein